MNRIHISLFCFCLITIPLFSQEVRISKELGIRNDLEYDLMHMAGGNTLLYRNKGMQYTFEVFDNEMGFKFSTDLSFEHDRVFVEGVVPLDSLVAVFYSYRIKNETFIKARTYSQDMTLRDTIPLLAAKDLSYRRLKMVTSADRSKTLLFAIRDRDLLTIVIDNNDFKVTWFNELNLFHMDLMDSFRKVLLTNEGKVLVLLEEDNTRNSKANHRLTLLRSSGTADFNVHHIHVKDAYGSSLEAAYDDVNDRIIVAGLLCKNSDYQTYGYYVFNEYVSSLQETSYAQIHSYPKELIRDIYGTRRPKDAIVEDQFLKELIVRSDGGIILLTEMEKEFVRRTTSNTFGGYAGRLTNNDPFASRGYVDYYHEDMLMISVSPFGNMEWYKVLYKKQFSQDDNGSFSSFLLLKTPSRIKIIYNDEIKNNNTVSEYVIDPNGKYERNTLLNTDYANLKLRFRNAVQIGSSEFLVPSEKNSKLSLVKVKI